MKLLLVVIFATICGLVLCGKPEWEENSKQCCAKHNVKMEDVKDVMHGKTKEADTSADLKCFFLCMGEKENLIKDGAFQPKVFAENLANSNAPDKDQMIEKVTAECNLKGKDDCDTAYKVALCIFNNRPHKM